MRNLLVNKILLIKCGDQDKTPPTIMILDQYLKQQMRKISLKFTDINSREMKTLNYK